MISKKENLLLHNREMHNYVNNNDKNVVSVNLSPVLLININPVIVLSAKWYEVSQLRGRFSCHSCNVVSSVVMPV